MVSVDVGAVPCGDLSGSGVFDVVDIVRLNGATVTGDDPDDCAGEGTLACGDLLRDGKLDLGDLLIGLNRLAGNDTLFFCSARGPKLACGARVGGAPGIDYLRDNQIWPDCTGVGDGTSVLIDGIVILERGVTVTVEAGAVVKGMSTTTVSEDGSVLLVSRGAKLNAPGTGTKPIVFTSDLPPGQRRAGDWGGVQIAGAAPVNFLGGVGSIEGMPPGYALFGGTKPNDSSGILRFVRIEFGGIPWGGEIELDVLGLYGVGAGTIIDHVQANGGADDCIEWFGGTVDAHHLVASNCRDDNFDFQIGWTGNLQYGLVVQNVKIANDSEGRHGIEADNNEFGFERLPRSEPQICNVTVIGAAAQTPAPPGSSVLGADGMRLRRGTAGHLHNSIFAGWSGDGIDIRADGTTCTLACTGELQVCNSITFSNGAAGTADECDDACAGSPCDPCAGYVSGCGLLEDVDPQFRASPFGDAGLPTSASDTIDGRYFPAAGGPADDVAPCPFGASAADYLGAFDPDGDPAIPGDADNWLLTDGGWISFAVR